MKGENIVDARGLTCPQPVILTKKVMDRGEAERITTLVDNTAALENVSKLAQSQGYAVEVEDREGTYYIHMTKAKQSETALGEEERQVTILVKSNRFGVGADELGEVLMKSFLYALTELESSISHLIFMNSGVFMTTEGSPVLEHLQALAAKGVQILSCGTCLDYYQLKDKLKVGEVTNMYAAMEILTRAPKALTF